MKSNVPTFATVRQDCDQPVVDLSAAPLPTAQTLKMRRSLPTQLLRFVAFNLRILRLVISGHH
ncbi:hypothetical protein [Aeromicrobium sp.]|uniref:hypothetical protein n=1 Tax=Aeromicrobium sp. TaxID=1871063 RepID=UPI002FCA59E4